MEPKDTPRSETDVTELLLAWNDGHKEALDQLMPIVVDELHRLAAIYLAKESSADTLQPTVLVNELYLRLVDRERVQWQNRGHFFGFAATTLRRILVDHARNRHAARRGGGQRPVSLDTARRLAGGRPIDILELDQALSDLAKLEPRQARVVELRFFVGLDLHEVAEVLGVGRTTVTRDWSTAKAWLHRELSRREG